MWALLLAFVLINPVERDIVSPYVDIEHIGAGTCLYVGNELLILTAAHVPTGKKVWTVTRGEEKTICDVVYSSPTYDLALLRPRTLDGLVAAKVATAAPVRGEDCYIIGTASGVHAHLIKTIVVHPAYVANGHPWLTTNGEVWYGSSGGGVYAKRRETWYLTGVVSWGNPHDGPRCITYHENIQSIRAMMDAYLKVKR